jgi:hypothetical protein
MKNEFIFPGTTSEEIDNNIENDSDKKEGNEKHYLYLQNLYQLILKKRDANVEFIKQDRICIKEFN